MFRSKLIPPLRRSMLILGAPLLLGACTAWHRSPSPAPAQEHALHSPVRATRRDGTIVVLDSAVVRGDSIFGFRQGAVEQHVAIPLAEVAKMEQREMDVPKTVLATAGGIVAGFGAYLILALESMRTSGS